MKTGFRAAVRRAGLPLLCTPTRAANTYASWHYALHRDPIRLMADGGWSQLRMVERYVDLMPTGQEDAIRSFLGFDVPATTARPSFARAWDNLV